MQDFSQIVPANWFISLANTLKTCSVLWSAKNQTEIERFSRENRG